MVRAAVTSILLLVFFAASLIQCRQQPMVKTVSGLKGEVEILRDKWGVNHIYASNTHDLFFAQGYAAAKDRLFQLEIWRRQATGTVAEILGENEFQRDLGARMFRYRGDMNKELLHYHPDGPAIINAFTEGINAYIRETQKDTSLLPVEFSLLNIKPQLWTPEVVISRHQGILTNLSQELNLGRAVQLRGEKMVKELMWFHPKDPLLSLDPNIGTTLYDKDILAPYAAMKKELVFNKVTGDVASNEPSPSLDGSNNWIISGSRSASGFPLLANDPHRKISVPSLRYLVHLSAPGWNVTGAGEPAIPGISIGHNDHGAWGLTIFETDSEDLYVYDIDPKDRRRYFHKGRWVMMREIPDTIHIRDAPSRIVTLRFTVHGPVTYIDSANNKAFAIRAAWLESGGAPYLSSLRMDQATTWEEFRDACAYGNIPGENMVWADKNGNIGWQVTGIIPRRNNFSGYVPVPGDGRFEWDGYLPIKERPHALNPAAGFLATANEHVTPDDYPHWNAIGFTWAEPFRGDRIRHVLGSKEKITINEMAALQNDQLALPAKQLIPHLKYITFNDPVTETAKKMLLSWDHHLSKTSTEASIYVTWESVLKAKAKREFVPEDIREYISLRLTKVVANLKDSIINFGMAKGLSKDKFIRESFEEAIITLQKRMGTDVSRWAYGQPKMKHVLLSHQLSGSFDIGPAARGGYANTVQATGDILNQNHGASFKIIADTKDWDSTLMINSPGQSADPRSKHYNDLFPLWVNDEYFPSYFNRKSIETVTVEKIRLRGLKP